MADLVWRTRGESQIASLPATPAMQAAIEARFSQTLKGLAYRSVVPVLLLVIAAFIWGHPLSLWLVVAAVGLAFASGAPWAFFDVLLLRLARQRPRFHRVDGPIRVEEHHSPRFGAAIATRKLYFGETESCHLSADAYRAITRVAQAQALNSMLGQATIGRIYTHTMTAAFNYSQTASLLLEIEQPTGEVIYRDPAYAGEPQVS